MASDAKAQEFEQRLECRVKRDFVTSPIYLLLSISTIDITDTIS
jgi:hypothetical protein